MIINKEQAKNIWINNLNGENLNIYINSPFCFSKCRYCLYQGKQNASTNIKNKFFEEYLPKELEYFEDVFNCTNEITTVYFGGGTPNCMTIEQLNRITTKSALSQTFSRSKNRIIEINPAFCNKKYIKELCQLGFTLITFGIQSFSKQALDFQKRPYCDALKIKEFISLCNEYGVYTSIDLMAYIFSYTNKDLGILKNDIEIALNTNPTFVTIYPELNLINIDKKIHEDYNNFMKNLVISPEIKNYYSDNIVFDMNIDERSICRLINNEYDLQFFRSNILPYYENDFPYAAMNIIGFGDYDCKQKVISYMPKKFMYHEINNNFSAMFDLQYISKDTII